MRDPTTQEQLSAWLDGELTDAEAAELEAELARDPLLRGDLDELREATELMRAHGRRDAPPDFLDKVLAATASEPMPIAGWQRFLRRPFGIPVEGLAVAAAALVIVAVGLQKFSTSSGDQAGWTDERTAAPSKENAAPAAQMPAGSSSYGSYEQKADDGAASAVRKLPEQFGKPSPKDLGATPAPVAATETTTPGTDNAQQALQTTTSSAPGTGEATPDQGTASGGYSIAFTTSDPDIIDKLHRLAGKYRGGMTSQSNIVEMRMGETATFFITIDSASLPSFRRDLQNMGLQLVETPDDKMHPDGQIQLRVDVTMQGTDQTDGMTQAQQQQTNAPATSYGSSTSTSAPTATSTTSTSTAPTSTPEPAKPKTSSGSSSSGSSSSGSVRKQK